MAKYDKNPNQIIRKDGKNTLMEVLDNSFEIGKALFVFQKYDINKPAGSRVTDKVLIYVPFEVALRLANEFTVSGVGHKRLLAEMKQAEQEGKSFYGQTLSMGGTNAEALKRQGRARSDGKAEARMLTIQPARNGKGYALAATQGPGAVNERTKGIYMSGRPDASIMIGLSYADWTEVLLATQAAIQGYLAASYQKRLSEGGLRPSYNNEENKPQEAPAQAPVAPAQTYDGVGMSSDSYDEFTPVDEDMDWGSPY